MHLTDGKLFVTLQLEFETRDERTYRIIYLAAFTPSDFSVYHDVGGGSPLHEYNRLVHNYYDLTGPLQFRSAIIDRVR